MALDFSKSSQCSELLQTCTVRFVAFPIFLVMKSVFDVSPVSLLASRILYSLQSHSLLQFSSSTPSNSTQSLPSRRNRIGQVPPAIDNYRPKQLCITRENGHKDLDAALPGLKYKNIPLLVDKAQETSILNECNA